MTASVHIHAPPNRLTIGLLGTQDREKGGVYQYSLSLVRALATAPSRTDQVLLFGYPTYPGLDELVEAGVQLVPAAPVAPQERRATAALKRRLAPIGDPIIEFAARRAGWVPPLQRRAELERYLRSAGVDLMIYPLPSRIAFEANVPYVMAIHDLQHRLNSDREEVAAGREWVELEYRYRHGARNALLILADSEAGKDDILRFYGGHGVTEDRVVVLPFVPPPYLAEFATSDDEVAAQYDLPPRFFFYPASTWPSKNHVALVRALAVLAQRIDDPPALVLCGSTRGPLRERTLADVRAAATEGGITDLVRHLGVVPDEHMAALYRRAVAMTMPTLLGPTNIPVVEAWSLGCPVLTSDLRGIRDQAGDAAVVIDPHDPARITDGLERLATDEALRKRLVARGRERLASYNFSDFQQRLVSVVDVARSKLAASRR